MLPPPGYTPASLAADLPSTTTTVLLTAATALASLTQQDTPQNGGSPSEPENGECRLLGPFAILVQSALGILALSALVYKRWRERPQRPLKIWFFDASKQVFGSVLVHMANLGMSMLSSGQFDFKVTPSSVSIVERTLALHKREQYAPNPCSFYLLNLAIDTTIGIPILIIILRLLTALFLLTPVGQPPESIASGNYGSPPRVMWWFKQSIIYFLGLMGMKLCVLIIFLVLPWISQVGDWALRWTEGNTALQIAFVMLVFPLIMNATQYYIIDIFIKNQKPSEIEVLPDGDDEDRESFHEDGSSEEIHSGDEDGEIKAVPVETVRHKRLGKGSGSGSYSPLKSVHRDYDPMYDGESSPTVVGNASPSLTPVDADRK